MPTERVSVDTAAIDEVRDEIGVVDQGLTAAGAEMARIDAELAAVRRSAVRPTQAVRRLERRMAAAGAERTTLLGRRAALRGRLDQLRNAVVTDVTPEGAVASLDGQVPVALLPVRIETRFFDDGFTLRIRIFPDDIHVHTHEPELTETEAAAGRDYWTARVIGEDPDGARLAWRALVAGHGADRAAWIVAAMTPTNLGDRRPGRLRFPDVRTRGAPWTRAPEVVAMPERWVAIGFRGNQEVFRKWGGVVGEGLPFGPAPDPVADAVTETPRPPAIEEELPIDDAMRWLVDFAEAERVGMAITVTNADLTGPGRPVPLSAGISRLVVLGVDWTRSPEQASQQVADLLAAHRHTEGLSLVPAGTPTNNTATGRTQLPGEVEDAVDALDPAVAPPPPTETSHARRLARALGLDITPFAGIPGGGLDDGEGASHMHNALWEATWGYFFDHILDGVATPAQVAELRAHFRTHVRGEGPLATLRIGDQPYGVLPVVAPGQWRPDDGETGAAAWMRVIDDGRGLWSQAAERSPHMGRTGDPGRDLLEMLQHTPTMSTVRFRNMFGPLYAANTTGLSSSAQLQELTGRWLFSMLGAEAIRPRIAACVINPFTRRLTVPLVQGGEIEPDATLDPDYIGSTMQRLSQVGGFATITKEDPTSLLHALLLHGARLEMGKAAAGLITGTPSAERGPSSRRATVAVDTGPEPELVDIESGTKSDTPLRFAGRKVAAISGNQTLANHIVGLPRPEQIPATRAFSEFRDSLGHLAALPVAELERLLKETLDCSSHRLDAWLTSFATRRLAAVRDATPAGVHIGGFGWVEDLSVGPHDVSQGYVHTPSLPHAATAAILRAGHMTHLVDEESPLAVDLSSRRVREALSLMDGVRQGQPVGALLGYRFERALRERDVRLARYILPFRRLAPLSADTGEGSGAAESIAARDVVDGVALLDQWRANESSLLDRAGVTGTSDRTAAGQELARLDDRLDAVADVLVAESVFQAVTGNLERAGAAAAALDRQRTPPEPDVVRTPRHGTDHIHRVAILLDDPRLPAGWEEVPVDLRAATEPLLNAWVARLLGDPERIRFAAEVRDGRGTVTEIVEARLPELGLSPLSVLQLAGSGGSDQATEMEERLALHLSTRVGDPDAAAELRLLTGKRSSWPAAALSLGDLLTLTESARRLVGGARPVDAADLSLPEEVPVPGVDLAELSVRAEAVVAAAVRAADDLTAAIDTATTTATRFRTVLEAASAVGANDAVPVSLGSSAEEAGALRSQAEGVARSLTLALETAQSAPAGISADTADDVAAAALIATIRALLGADFPVLPRFRLADPAECAASLADRAALTGGDDLAATQWLQRRALVRPPVGRLAELLGYAELVGADTGATDLHVIQLPHLPGDRWVAADLPEDGAVPAGRIAVTVHSATPPDVTGPMAGLLIDDWMETIPATVETTGVAVHYDAPGSRAPQAVLLAVPPDPEATGWSVEALRDTVVEALQLAKIRAVDPQQIWMAGRVLPALYVAHNIAGDTSAVNFFDLQLRKGATTGTVAPGREG